MFMKIFMKVNICLILVTNMNEIGKMTDESKEKRNDKFTGLKSKMHSLTNEDGKEKKQENESILSKT